MTQFLLFQDSSDLLQLRQREATVSAENSRKPPEESATTLVHTRKLWCYCLACTYLYYVLQVVCGNSAVQTLHIFGMVEQVANFWSEIWHVFGIFANINTISICWYLIQMRPILVARTPWQGSPDENKPVSAPVMNVGAGFGLFSGSIVNILRSVCTTACTRISLHRLACKRNSFSYLLSWPKNACTKRTPDKSVYRNSFAYSSISALDYMVYHILSYPHMLQW